MHHVQPIMPALAIMARFFRFGSSVSHLSTFLSNEMTAVSTALLWSRARPLSRMSPYARRMYHAIALPNRVLGTSSETLAVAQRCSAVTIMMISLSTSRFNRSHMETPTGSAL
jgi:hypothetical protein